MRSVQVWLSCAAALLIVPEAGAQQAPPPPPHSDAQPDDIVVEGNRDLVEGGITTARPQGTSAPNPRESALANRTKFEFSQRIAKCVGRGKFSGPAQLRAVLDDAPNKASQAYAQDQLKRLYVTCSEGASLLSFTGSLGYSIYDRGAYMIEALRLYAPELKLTSKETGDPAVQARFDAREVPRNRYRLPVDHFYFEVAVCLVRLQPRLAVRLAQTDGPPKQVTRIASAIVDNARACVGDAKRVYFDPTQLRLYIADAVYRWAVAAKGVDSLIPAG